MLELIYLFSTCFSNLMVLMHMHSKYSHFKGMVQQFGKEAGVSRAVLIASSETTAPSQEIDQHIIAKVSLLLLFLNGLN